MRRLRVLPTCIPAELYFFYNNTATTEIYTLSLHDALPISEGMKPTSAVKQRAIAAVGPSGVIEDGGRRQISQEPERPDGKSTRLNSSHTVNSYDVICSTRQRRESEGLIVVMKPGNAGGGKE